MTTVNARIYLLSHEDGGRLCPYAMSGYRPNLKFGDVYVCSEVLTGNGADITSGQWTNTRVRIPSGEHLPAGSFSPGAKFLVAEGSHVVGEGIVTELVE